MAQEKFNAQEEDVLLKLLDVTKNGFLGIYFFMELGTIVSSLTSLPFSLLPPSQFIRKIAVLIHHQRQM